MRVLLAIFVAVIFYATVSNALDADPGATPPYCWPLTNFTIANGTSLFDLLYGDDIANPIFVNGQDPNDVSGYGLGHELWDWGLYGVVDWGFDDYQLPNGDPDAFFWAIMDGTNDAVDAGLSFAAFVNGANTSFTQGNLMCGQNEQTAIVSAQSFDDVAIEFQLYVPTGNSSSWGRVAINMKNNGQASADVNAILVNNWGSDGSTVYMVVDNHYSCSADSEDPFGASDPLVCYYFKSAGSNASPFWWNDLAPRNGSDYVFPAWNFTLAAGQSVTLLQFLSQNSPHNWTELQTEAAWINSNPIDIYAALPQGYHAGLMNFDLCSATGIVYPAVSLQTACSTNGGKATYKVDTLDSSFASLYPQIKVGNTTVDLALTAGTMVDVPAGTYDLTLMYGDCQHTLPQITVTCPAAPTSAPTSTAPTAKTSSASSVGAVVGWAVVLGALLY